MKALTLWQPWASLICDGRKTIETRHWPTAHRGLLAIHAGKHVDAEAARYFGYNPNVIIRGAVVCVVELTNCVPNPLAPPDEYGDFAPGRFGFLFVLHQILEPVPVVGHQGMWNWARIK